MTPDPVTIVLLVLAGVATGLVGYLTGLASLVSYPALLAVGIPPLSANATNTVGLVGVGFGTLLKSEDVWTSNTRAQVVQQTSLAAAGGLIGSALLLVTGEKSFTRLVPWLIGLASMALLLTPWLRKLAGTGERWGWYLAAMFLLCIYSGYFGAGAGVVYFAVMSALTTRSWGYIATVKSIMMAVSNLAAALLFVFLAPIDWIAALVMFIGNLLGGYLGPILQRYVPEKAARVVTALGGFYLAWSLAH